MNPQVLSEWHVAQLHITLRNVSDMVDRTQAVLDTVTPLMQKCVTALQELTAAHQHLVNALHETLQRSQQLEAPSKGQVWH